MIRSSLLGLARAAHLRVIYCATGHNTTTRLVRQFCSSSAGGYARFRPTRSLKFDKSGKSLIAYTKIKGYYLFCSLVAGVLVLILFKGFHSLYNYDRIGWFKRVFWFLLAAGTLAAAFSLHNALREVITKVWLKSCGRKLLIRKGFAYMPKEEVLIQNITRAGEDQLQEAGAMLLVGYPVTINGEQFILPKTMERPRQDIFGAVFNGMEIDLEDPPNEIIIE